VLVEVTFGIGQIFMGDGAKHRAQSYQPSQKLRVPATHLLISCLLSFTVLSFYPKTNRQRCRWDTKCTWLMIFPFGISMAENAAGFA
jgi:hypothetical protein